MLLMLYCVVFHQFLLSVGTLINFLIMLREDKNSRVWRWVSLDHILDDQEEEGTFDSKARFLLNISSKEWTEDMYRDLSARLDAFDKKGRYYMQVKK